MYVNQFHKVEDNINL